MDPSFVRRLAGQVVRLWIVVLLVACGDGYRPDGGPFRPDGSPMCVPTEAPRCSGESQCGNGALDDCVFVDAVSGCTVGVVPEACDGDLIAFSCADVGPYEGVPRCTSECFAELESCNACATNEAISRCAVLPTLDVGVASSGALTAVLLDAGKLVLLDETFAVIAEPADEVLAVTDATSGFLVIVRTSDGIGSRRLFPDGMMSPVVPIATITDPFHVVVAARGPDDRFLVAWMGISTRSAILDVDGNVVVPTFSPPLVYGAMLALVGTPTRFLLATNNKQLVPISSAGVSDAVVALPEASDIRAAWSGTRGWFVGLTAVPVDANGSIVGPAVSIPEGARMRGGVAAIGDDLIVVSTNLTFSLGSSGAETVRAHDNELVRITRAGTTSEPMSIGASSGWRANLARSGNDVLVGWSTRLARVTPP